MELDRAISVRTTMANLEQPRLHWSAAKSEDFPWSDGTPKWKAPAKFHRTLRIADGWRLCTNQWLARVRLRLETIRNNCWKIAGVPIRPDWNEIVGGGLGSGPRLRSRPGPSKDHVRSA